MVHSESHEKKLSDRTVWCDEMLREGQVLFDLVPPKWKKRKKKENKQLAVTVVLVWREANTQPAKGSDVQIWYSTKSSLAKPVKKKLSQAEFLCVSDPSN